MKAILFLLYVLQGIPLGLAGSIPMMLQQKGVSYKDQAFFSNGLKTFFPCHPDIDVGNNISEIYSINNCKILRNWSYIFILKLWTRQKFCILAVFVKIIMGPNCWWCIYCFIWTQKIMAYSSTICFSSCYALPIIHVSLYNVLRVCSIVNVA